MKKIVFLFIFMSFTLTQAQNNAPTEEIPLSLSKQFEELYRKSSTYQEYKVISITKYNNLKGNVADSLNAQKALVKQKNIVINKNNQELTSLKNQLSNIELNLQESLSQKDSRSILGLNVEKSVFSSIILFSYLVLILLTAFFAFKFKQNINTTKKAVSSLNSLELEFEKHKKTSLKRFQEVNRKLQDELNKNWKKEK